MNVFLIRSDCDSQGEKKTGKETKTFHHQLAFSEVSSRAIIIVKLFTLPVKLRGDDKDCFNSWFYLEGLPQWTLIDWYQVFVCLCLTELRMTRAESAMNTRTPSSPLSSQWHSNEEKSPFSNINKIKFLFSNERNHLIFVLKCDTIWILQKLCILKQQTFEKWF